MNPEVRTKFVQAVAEGFGYTLPIDVEEVVDPHEAAESVEITDIQ